MSERGVYLGGDRERLLKKLRSLVDDLEAGAYPEACDIPVFLDRWRAARRDVPCLVGMVQGHPKLSDGRMSVSSELFYIDDERHIARTLSRWYRLGMPADPQI